MTHTYESYPVILTMTLTSTAMRSTTALAQVCTAPTAIAQQTHGLSTGTLRRYYTYSTALSLGVVVYKAARLEGRSPVCIILRPSISIPFYLTL